MFVSPEIDLLLCALAPFLAAVAAPYLWRVFGDWTGAVLALLPAAICAYLISLHPQVVAGETISLGVPWVPALGLELRFVVDGLSFTFATLIAGIGVLILIYSGSYLHGQPHHGRFLGYLMMFMGAMLGLVLADNSIALFAFWELTTVSSFLLIGFEHSRAAARRAAIQAFVVTNIGGLALLVAAVAIYLGFGTWSLAEFRALEDSVLQSGLYPMLLTCILAAAFTKSAQFPLHFWLPTAMQAPTPVSAYLHSATMVQAGIYLLARTSPSLGGSPAWTLILTCFGGATLIWGGVSALRQTDLKQVLAQTTVASLGLLVLLLGLDTEAAVTAAVTYFVAHAFYKAALFLCAGIIEHRTGARDLRVLGGLRDRLTITFLVATVAAVSMIGIPPALGFLAKEETYAATLGPGWLAGAVVIALVLGNVLLTAAALAVTLKPFMGHLLETPRDPREASPALLLGPAILACLGLALGWATGWFGSEVSAPAVSTILGHPIQSHAAPGIALTSPAFALSVITWVLGAVLYWQLGGVRSALQWSSARIGWTFDAGFDAAMFGLVRGAATVTRTLQHGRLELYLVLTFLLVALATLIPPLVANDWPSPDLSGSLALHEVGTLVLAGAGVLTVFLARTRLFAIVALGIQGATVALLYMLFGAPDLSFTQFMVEILSVVIFALVMTRLRLDNLDPRPLEDLLRDGALALFCGLGIVVALFHVLERPFDAHLSAFFAENSVPLAHGRNIVNVILVDFRGLDTLGEISVVMAAGIAILALMQQGLGPSRRRRGKRGALSA